MLGSRLCGLALIKRTPEGVYRYIIDITNQPSWETASSVIWFRSELVRVRRALLTGGVARVGLMLTARVFRRSRERGGYARAR